MADEPYNSDSDSDYLPSDGESSPLKSSSTVKRVAGEAVSEEGKPAAVEEVSGNMDDLWADFLVEAGEKPSSSAAAPPEKAAESVEQPAKEEAPEKKGEPKTKTVEEIFEFAGEEVRVEKVVSVEAEKAGPAVKRKAPGGISSILSAIKPPKISTLTKSKMDWDRYKEDKQLDEELETHNRGKDGYLARQEFLQRTDHRQFEREKESRNKSRKKPFS